MSCISAHDPQLARLAEAIAQRVGPQRFNVWFNNSTKLDLKQDGLEISVPNDFISEWIGTHYTRPIQEAANEVLGAPLAVRFCVVPQLFVVDGAGQEHKSNGASPAGDAARNGNGRNVAARRQVRMIQPAVRPAQRALISGRSPADAEREATDPTAASTGGRTRLRHDLETFVVGHGNQLAFNAAVYVAEYPGGQYNPLFLHGTCGLGKSHLLQGLCRRFLELHPTKRWMYLTGEEFTNDFLTALRHSRVDAFRRKMRDLDLLVIDDVHFLSGKRATQEEFLHTFNAIEAMGKQVVLASDEHPKMIHEFGESLINRFVSGMVVRLDPPNFATRCEILRQMSQRAGIRLHEDVIAWIARRVTQNVRELEGAVNKIIAHVRLTGRVADVSLAQEVLGELDRQMIAPVSPDNILASVCSYFGLEHRDLMSGRRQRTISLARSVAMFLIRKTAKLSFPEIGVRMGKRNHSTVISACRRIERAVMRNEMLSWTSTIGERCEEAQELIQRLEEQARAMS
ncbi:MAG: chromosomal replication initiator protein DnaA [Phycisphaerae bacterium]|nr:chromosomal replication initiator protein DnaA [Phycisphaerae bacterium]MDW8262862.1 chromosomal replication initiator protein DnaA [Phycisphaerales bacterium]